MPSLDLTDFEVNLLRGPVRDILREYGAARDVRENFDRVLDKIGRPVGLKSYRDALAAAQGLVEEPGVDAPGRREYMRGMVELIADLFGFPPDKAYIAERKFEIAMDLNWPPEMVE